MERKKVKLYYCTPYTDGTPVGYVFADEYPDYYVIWADQYKRAEKKMTIGNTTPQFFAGKPVRVWTDKNGGYFIK